MAAPSGPFAARAKSTATSIKGHEKMKDKDPVTIHQQIVRSLGGQP